MQSYLRKHSITTDLLNLYNILVKFLNVNFKKMSAIYVID